ncbi:MAG: hypothetical protein KC668_22035 [Myxococcales bacterium]|nr:hypothetical protein [Myxococcales bacterium]
MDTTRRPPAPKHTRARFAARALSLMFTLVMTHGCGPRPPAHESSEGAASGGEAGDGARTGASAPEGGGSPDACDPSLVSLVGRFSLTRYPGQDDVGPNGERPLGMSKEYEFTGDAYTMEGYPPLRVTGRYEVLERDGLRQRVRFFDTVFDGQPDQDRELWIVFEDCGDTLQMDGMTYSRQANEP